MHIPEDSTVLNLRCVQQWFFIVCSLKKPATDTTDPDFDTDSTLNYDKHDPDVYLGQWRGHIAVNPKYPTIWLVTVHNQYMVLIDVLDGWFVYQDILAMANDECCDLAANI